MFRGWLVPSDHLLHTSEEGSQRKFCSSYGGIVNTAGVVCLNCCLLQDLFRGTRKEWYKGNLPVPGVRTFGRYF